MKPFLSDKTVTRNEFAFNMNLRLTEKKKVVENYLNKINLIIPSYQSCPASIDTNLDPITNKIEK